MTKSVVKSLSEWPLEPPRGGAPVRFARYVGRVGALAVALGVGLAGATSFGAGVARADEAGGAEPSASATDTAHPDKPDPTEESGAADEAGEATEDDAVAEDAAAEDDAAEDDEAAAEDAALPDEGQREDVDDKSEPEKPDPPARERDRGEPAAGKHSPSVTEARATDKPEAAVSVTVGKVSPTESLTPVGGSSVSSEPQSVAGITVTPAAVEAVKVPAPVARAVTNPVVEVAVSAGSGHLSPFVSPLSGGTRENPLVSALLAWARRLDQRSLVTTQSAAVALAAVNTRPRAVNDGPFTVSEDGSLTLTYAQLVGNDIDPDTATGDILSVYSVATNRGTVVNELATKTVKYTPPANYSGAASFVYRVVDAARATSTTTATVNITVTPVNDGPTAVNDGPFTVSEDASLTLTFAQLVRNDVDPDKAYGDVLAVTSATTATGTVFNDVANKTVTFITLTNYTGPASFMYRTVDASGAVSANTATVSITVKPVNDVPTAVNDGGFTVAEDGSLTVTAAQLVGNDLDPDTAAGDILSVYSVATANGTVVRNPNGTVTFRPLANYSGPALFTYRVRDKAGAVSDNTATVTVTVTPVNDAPAAVNDAGFTVRQGQSLTLTYAQLAVNDLDLDKAFGDTLSVSSVAAASGTVVNDVANRTVTFTPSPNVLGPASFTYLVNDAAGVVSANAATVSLIVKPAAAPTAVTGVGAVTVDGVSRGAVLSADGTRAIVSTLVQTQSGPSAGFTVVNTETGTKIGSTVNVRGEPGAVQFSSDGSRAVVVALTDSLDGWGNSETRVVIINTATGAQVGTTYVAINGGGVNPVTLNANGTRAVVDTRVWGYTPSSRVVLLNVSTGAKLLNNGSSGGLSATFSQDGTRMLLTASGTATTVTMINAATGAKMGSISRSGSVAAQLSYDNSRAVVATVTGSPATQDYSTAVEVLDTVTGARIGPALTFDGAMWTPATFTVDGTRAVLTPISYYGFDSSSRTTGLVVINMASGAQVGNTITLAGSPVSNSVTAEFAPAQLNPIGTRAVVTTGQFDGTNHTARLAGVDVVTGDQVSSTLTVAGRVYSDEADGDYGVQFSPDGTRALLVTRTGDQGNYTITVTILDSAVGALVGTPKTFTSTSYRTPRLSADGSRVVVVADNGTDTTTTVLDAATSAPVGTPLTIAGNSTGAAQLSSDGSCAVVTAVTSGGQTRVLAVNTSTATQIGSVATLSGSAYGPAKLSGDGTRIVVATSANQSTGPTTIAVGKIT